MKLRNTAKNYEVPETGMFAISTKALINLYGQFPCWRKYQCFYVVIFHFVISLQKEILQDGNGKSCCFPGSCLGATQQIFSLQYVRNSPFLDWRGGGITFCFERL